MNFSSLKWASLIAVFLISCGPEKEKRVLLFADKQNNNGLGIEGLKALDTYLRKNNLRADTTTSKAFFNEDSLAHYGAIALINPGRDLLQVREQNEIERFIQAGGGIAVIHPHAATRYQWQWFNELIGIEASDQTEVATLTLQVTDDGVPSTTALGLDDAG